MKIEQDKVAKINNQKQKYLSNALTIGNVQVVCVTYKNSIQKYSFQAPLLMLAIGFGLSLLVFLFELAFASRIKMEKKQKLFIGNAGNNI